MSEWGDDGALIGPFSSLMIRLAIVLALVALALYLAVHG